MTAPPLTREQAQILVDHCRMHELLKRSLLFEGNEHADRAIDAMRSLIAIAEAEE